MLFFLCTLWLGPQTEWSQLERPGAQAATFFHDAGRDRLVFFANGANDQLIRVWERVQDRWHLRPTTVGAPPGREYFAAAGSFATGYAVLFGGRQRVYSGSTVRDVYLSDTWLWDGSTWTQANVPGPSPRNSHKMSFNPATQTFLLYGGIDANGVFLSDTWEWNGQSWRMVGQGPWPGYGAGMAYDPVLGGMLLFGGSQGGVSRNSGTWLWNGGSWVQVATGSPGRIEAQCATDWGRGRVLLHSGFGQPGDTWEWDGTQWMQRDAGGYMPDRWTGGMTYDWRRGQMLLGYGYSTSSRLYVADLWSWNGTRWQALEDAPPAFDATTLAHHETDGVTVLFSGSYNNSILDDTWLLRGAGWQRANPQTRPLSRATHAMAYDAVRQEVVMFGGAHGNSLIALDDTWVWRGGQWTQRFPAAHPSARLWPQMAFDRQRGELVLNGGWIGNVQPLGDTWVWDGTNWSPRQAQYSIRDSPSMAYDEVRGKVVLVGRAHGFVRPYTLEWDGTAWSTVGSAGPDVDGSLVYSAETGTCLFIGHDRQTTRGEVWSWDGTTWSLLGPSPITYGGCGRCYDWTRRQVVFLGGQYRTNSWWVPPYLGETWFLRAQSLSTRTPEPRPGTTAYWDVHLPGAASYPFVLGLSGGRDGIPVAQGQFGNPVLWPLSPDRLFAITFGMPSLIGVLDSQGRGVASLALPNDPLLEGLYVVASALAINPTLQPAAVSQDVAVMLYR